LTVATQISIRHKNKNARELARRRNKNDFVVVRNASVFCLTKKFSSHLRNSLLNIWNSVDASLSVKNLMLKTCGKFKLHLRRPLQIYVNIG